MSEDIYNQLFKESFVRGVGKTTGALITMFVGLQLFKVTNEYDNYFSDLFMNYNKKSLKHTVVFNKKFSNNIDNLHKNKKLIVGNDIDDDIDDDIDKYEELDYNQTMEMVSINMFKTLFDNM